MNNECSDSSPVCRTATESKEKSFTVMIGDGQKDSSDEIFYFNRGTTVIINNLVPAVIGHRLETEFGTLKVWVDRSEIKARFLNVPNIAVLHLLDKLVPAVGGKVHKRNGSFVEVIEITEISFTYSNQDPRIKSLSEQSYTFRP